MKKNEFTRRRFIAAVSAGSVAAAASGAFPSFVIKTGNAEKLAILGGEPVRKNMNWPRWPYLDDKVLNSVISTTKSGKWCRTQG